jgi:hypothetical protein
MTAGEGQQQFNRLSEQLVVRKSPASKAVNTEADGSTSLETVTRQPVKTTDWEDIARAVVYYSVCESAIVL